MSRLELLPCRGERGLVDVPVNPITVLKVVLKKRVDDVERGKNSDQIAIVVAGRIQGLVAGRFFGRGSRSWTFLWGTIEIKIRGKGVNCDQPSTTDWQHSWVQHNIRGGRACRKCLVCFPL